VSLRGRDGYTLGFRWDLDGLTQTFLYWGYGFAAQGFVSLLLVLKGQYEY
jgi:hypothetical protein